MNLRLLLFAFVAPALTVLADPTNNNNDAAANGDAIGRTARGNIAERNTREYYAQLLSRISQHLDESNKKGKPFTKGGDIILEDLGIDSLSSTLAANNINYAKAESVGEYQSTKEDGLLNIPFGDIFALDPSNIRYIANLLNVVSRIDPQHLGKLSPMLGIGSNSLRSSEGTESVSNLLASIASMDVDTLKLISKATSVSIDAEDSLLRTNSLFALSNILSMDTKRVSQVTAFLASISRLQPSQLESFFRDIGWDGQNIHKSADLSSNVNHVPNFSYLFPVSNALLKDMTDAALLYASGTTDKAHSVRPAVMTYLKGARDFLDFIPGYSTISSIIDIGSSPIVDTLTQIIALTHKYPNASYWEIVLQYYKDIGLPGLNALSNYPSQYIGGLASSIVGGYVSGAISGIVADMFGPTLSVSSSSKSDSTMLSSLKDVLSGMSPAPTATAVPSIAPSNSIASSMSSLKPATPTLTTISALSRSATSRSPLLASPGSGIWDGVFDIVTPTKPVPPLVPAPTPKPTPPILGAASFSHTASRAKTPLSATLDLNQNYSTRIVKVTSNMKLTTASIIAILGSASSVVATFYIPGIVNLDINDGLKLDVLGGLIHANIGDHSSRRGNRGNVHATPPAAVAPTASVPPTA
ncbi:hypothetical protein H4R24_000181 [Coemansia sp. RSA 988]|nr:hypothetical protein H4R24_000181 [Coemansia sp. RSA 988]